MIKQSQWTPPASDWSNSHIGHSQTQTDYTVSVDTLQPQTDQTVSVDILNLGLIIHIGRLTTSDFYTFTLDPQPPTEETVPVRPTTSDWSDIHSGHPHPQTEQRVAVDTLQPQTDQRVAVETLYI